MPPFWAAIYTALRAASRGARWATLAYSPASWQIGFRRHGSDCCPLRKKQALIAGDNR